MSAAFGRMVDERATELGLKDYQLQSAIGLLADNKAFTAEQFGRLRKGGYRLVPEAYEFWQHRDDRMHDRLRYRRVDGDWLIERLSP